MELCGAISMFKLFLIGQICCQSNFVNNDELGPVAAFTGACVSSGSLSAIKALCLPQQTVMTSINRAESETNQTITVAARYA